MAEWGSSSIEFYGQFNIIPTSNGPTIRGDFERLTIHKGGREAVDITGFDLDFYKFDMTGQVRGARPVLDYLFSGNDRVLGSASADELAAGEGKDRVNGNAGDDWLAGEAGHDRLDGGKGRDVLEGGAGSDSLTGGSGRDVFRFEAASETARGDARDVITDFGQGDRIDLGQIDALESRAGNQAFDFIGRHGFSGEAGELRQVGWIVEGDTDGNGRADFSIRVAGGVTLQADDFIL
jgi:Ca2+-binding RTX toxin-like protein